jgi:acetylglutamate kinase
MIAAALQAEKLIIVTDGPGVLTDKDDVFACADAAASAAAHLWAIITQIAAALCD